MTHRSLREAYHLESKGNCNAYHRASIRVQGKFHTIKLKEKTSP